MTRKLPSSARPKRRSRRLVRARVVLGVMPNFRRIRAANDPKA